MSNRNDCKNRREAIAALVLGELETPAADELRKHIDVCEVCRNLYQALAGEEETIRSAFKAITDRTEMIEERLVKQFDKHSPQPLLRGPAALRRLWTGLRATKQTTKIAVAVLIIIGIGGIIAVFTRGTGSGVTFADIVRPLLTARTATFKATYKVKGFPAQTFEGMFMEPARMRHTTAEGVIIISGLQQGKIITLTLVPAEKKAMVMEMGNIPEMENIPENEDQSQFNIFLVFRRFIQQAQETEDESVEFLGEQEINGLSAIGYQVQKPGVDITVWADAETLLPIRLEMSMGPVANIMSDIVFDVELDEALFTLEIPEEYTVRTFPLQVDASEPTEKDLFEMFRVWTDQMDGSFPSVLDKNATMFNAMIEFVKYQKKKMREKGQEEPSEQDIKTIMKISRGGMFVQQLPPESDWHYAGKGVKLGDADTPVFWYQPKDSDTYCVIYGDLSVKDVAPEDLPKESAETN